MLRRAAVVAAGLAMGVTAAIAMLPVVAGIAVAFAPDGSAWGTQLVEFVLTILSDPQPERSVTAAARATWSLGMLVCCMPVLIAALVGEVAGLRGFGWLVGATALVTAVLPAAMVTSKFPKSQMPDWMRAESLALLCIGVCAGLAYWSMAGERKNSQRAV